MDFILSDHAKSECWDARSAWNGLKLRWLVRTENDDFDPTLVHALRPIPEKGFRILRVIYNETRTPVIVVTAYFDKEGDWAMKLEFDPQADAVYLELTDAEAEKSDEIQPGVILDYDAEGQIVGIEVLYISKRNQLPLPKAA